MTATSSPSAPAAPLYHPTATTKAITSPTPPPTPPPPSQPSSPSPSPSSSSSSSSFPSSSHATAFPAPDNDPGSERALSPNPTDDLVSLREPPSSDLPPRPRPTLAQFRHAEGASVRAAKLEALWDALPPLPDFEQVSQGPTDLQKMQLPGQDSMTALSQERAERLRALYEEELVKRVRQDRPQASLWGGADDLEPVHKVKGKGVAWKDFRRFLWDQEHELWDIFQDIDRNGDGRLDANEMREALSRSGINVTPATINDLVRFLASGASGSPSHSSQDLSISFQEFRDFLFMLPRRATPFEIYKFYQVRKRFSDGRGAARVDKDGDLNPSFPKSPNQNVSTSAAMFGGAKTPENHDNEYEDGTDDIHADEDDKHDAWRFLLAGGIAGAVSRTVTAPFDRLKVYLITHVPDHIAETSKSTATSGVHPLHASINAGRNLWAAVTTIYTSAGGLRAFWVGNGLNVLKIFPESAIKFVTYEQCKLFFAKYWDKVHDPADLSSSSRFVAGGFGGITSQFAIYGLETLKTRVQSEMGPAQGWRSVVSTAQSMWRSGGVRAYYRGLTLGLIGVFPYSAIDMGTYETLKKAYCRSTGKDEPEVYAVLSFGALSGSIGAASVYPINLLRTRLQASGSTGHPQKYTGFLDVLSVTLKNEGPRGLYKGLLPSIMKVGPAVGVSWIVYEDAKRRLGV